MMTSFESCEKGLLRTLIGPNVTKKIEHVQKVTLPKEVRILRT